MCETQEFNALCEKIPERVASQLRTWALQAHLFDQLYPRALEDNRPCDVRLNDVTIETFWWGFHVVVPERVMIALETEGASVRRFVAAISGDVHPAKPFMLLAGAYVTMEMKLLKAVNRGRGVHVAMAWLAPGIFVPTAI